MPSEGYDRRIADTEEAVFDRVIMTVDLPVVSSVHRIGPGVWRAVYADGRTYATVYAGAHPRSGEFDVTHDFATAQRREAEAGAAAGSGMSGS